MSVEKHELHELRVNQGKYHEPYKLFTSWYSKQLVFRSEIFKMISFYWILIGVWPMQSDPSNNNVHSILKYSDVKYRIMFFFFFKSKCKSLHRFIKKQLEFKKWNESIKSKQKTDIELKVNQLSNRTVTKHWMIPQAITWQLMSCVLIMHEHYYLVSRGNNSRWQKGHIFSQWRSYWALYLSSFVFENVPKGRDLSLKSFISWKR